jgi:hypothetical protein
VPTQSYFRGVYKLSNNKSAGKDLLEFLMQRENVEALDIASDGYDPPPYARLNDFRIREEVGPPKGTVVNYPIRPSSGERPLLTASETAPEGCGADLQPRRPQPDVGPPAGRPDDPAGGRPGGGRNRQLHAIGMVRPLGADPAPIAG